MSIKQVLIALDQLLNTLLAGHADETLSARSYRMHTRKRRWNIAMKFIDRIFFWQENHCMQSYLSEIERKHLPCEYNNYSPRKRVF